MSSALLVSFRLHDPDALVVDFEQVLISVILFTALFANWIMICSISAEHVQLLLFCLHTLSTLAANFEQVTLPVICFLPYLPTTY